MSFKLNGVFLMVTVFMFVNGDIYVSHDSSSDSSSESEDDNDKIMRKLEAIYSKLNEPEGKVSQLNTTEEPLQYECPNEWTRFHGSCYYFGLRDVEFLEAQVYCEAMHASLVNIDNELEYSFIKSQLQVRKAPKHWIGMTDERVEGEWKNYPSGKSATFIIWGNGEPNAGNTVNCGAIWESFGYKYVDEPCTDRNFRPICEKRI